jgi:hypothetical protein
MSAVLLAVFDEYQVAERVRVELVRHGFPTDRIELTAGCEPGRAGLAPADSPHARFVQYFRGLFTFEDERHHAEQLAIRVDNGAATITVHPRGSMETGRATQILLNARAVQLISHDLANQTPQWAVARGARPWIIGAPALCLLLAGYLVNKREFEEIGLRATPPELRLEHAQETVPSESELPHEGYSPPSYISVVIAHYFDTYLGPGEPRLESLCSRYTRVGDRGSSCWALCNAANTANTASRLGAAFCGSYNAGRSPVPMTHDLGASQRRWLDLTDKVVGAAPISTGP